MRKLTVSLVLVAVIGLGISFYSLFFSPYRIIGGDIGPYKKGQRVFTISKELRDVKKGDVVILRPDTRVDWIVEIKALPGEILPDNLNGEKVPKDGYWATNAVGQQQWIPEDLVIRVVWGSY